jgi:SpoVK/Ycf46/Vps4 family AAA+-type ATPase
MSGSARIRIPTRTIPSGGSGNANGLEEVLNEIAGLIGMDDIKMQLNELIALGRVIAIRRERDIPLTKMSLHLVFTGPPGTGKTVVARKIGKLFKAIGLLRKGHCVEVDKSMLTGRFIGETGKIVQEVVKDALDGVLFIDEAYALAGGAAQLAQADQFGTEAIDTLLKLMEDNRDRLVVIAAGYEAPMRRFLDNNVGLKSRFTRQFDFKSYSHEELTEIFWVIAKDSQYKFEPAAQREVEKYIRSMDRNRPDFGNARDVRNFLEKIVPVQAMRLGELDNLENLSNEEFLTITADDVRTVSER